MSEKMPNENTDLTWREHMQMLIKRMRKIEVADIIDQAIWEWYFEMGKEVPNWKCQKDPKWWTDYLKELDNEK